MRYGLAVRHEAAAEMEQAAAWYETQSFGRGEDFQQEVRSCIARILQGPQRSTVVSGELRRALVRRFPYAIYFYCDEDDVFVVACMHFRRDPARLRERL